MSAAPLPEPAYYLASNGRLMKTDGDVDCTGKQLTIYTEPQLRAALAERDAEIAELKTAHKANTTNMLELLAKHKQHAFNIAAQRKVLEQALEALKQAHAVLRNSIHLEEAITAIQEVLT